ncbi:MAG: clostripain-related cysteine peptidase [Promethearchaeota archaeon]
MEPKPRAAASRDWTFMVYVDADNNLEAAGIDDINEMEIVGSTSSVSIVAQLDRTSGYDTSNGDWTGARRYEISKDTGSSTITSTLKQDLGEVDMGSQSTLNDFVSWATTNYPATHYALVLWDHGSGPLWGSSIGGVCWDDTSSSDYLTPQEITGVLSSYSIDLVAFDACLMGSAEMFHELKDYAGVVVGSEKVEPGDGYPYDDILQWLVDNPSASAESLGSTIVQKYGASYPSYAEVTQTAVRTTSLSSLASAVDTLAQDVLAYGTTYNPEVRAARDASLHFDDNPFIDLYDFCANLKVQISDSTIRADATAVQDAITTATVSEFHSSTLSGAHGVSIYFPDDPTSYKSAYEGFQFCTATQWEEFVKNALSPTTVDDSFEENDAPSQAAEVIAGTYTLLRINSSDDDYYNITLHPGGQITASIDFLTGGGVNLDLFLYNPLGVQVMSSTGSTGHESLTYTAVLDGNHTLRVQPTSALSSLTQYDMTIDAPVEDDAYESGDLAGDNDVYSNPRTLTTNQTYSDLVGQDDDYYKFSVPEGVLINISVTFAAGQGDLDLYLIDYDGANISSSATAGNEEILNGSVNGGTSAKDYVLYVCMRRLTVRYELKLYLNEVDDAYDQGIGNEYSGYETDISTGTYPDLVCIDNDYYNVTITAGNWLNATVWFGEAGGDLDLYLYDPSGSLVAWALSSDDDEVILYHAADTGEYTLLVYPYEVNLNYTLVLSYTSLTDDSFEPNDFFEDARTITFGTAYPGLASWNWDFYEVTVPAGVRFSFEIEFDHTKGDLDLYVFQGTFDDLVDCSAGTGDLERVTWSASASPRTFQLLVYNNYEMNPNYTLRTRENDYPTAGFSASPGSGPAPLEVSFTDTSTSSDGIAGWAWDFGDGNTSTTQNPGHAYYVPGTYLVELSVVEGDGDESLATVQVIVANASSGGGGEENPGGSEGDLPGVPPGAAVAALVGAVLVELAWKSRNPRSGGRKPPN